MHLHDTMFNISYPIDNDIITSNLHQVLDINLFLGGKKPQDSTVVMRTLESVITPIYIVMCILTTFGIIIALIFLFINNYYRKNRYIILLVEVDRPILSYYRFLYAIITIF